jgi:hypothetical protein
MAALLVILAIVGCTSDDSDSPTPPADGKTAVELALCVSPSQSEGGITRMSSATIQGDNNFRDIQDLKLIPLNSEGNVAGSMLQGLERVEDKNYYFSHQIIDLNIGTSRFLCYAKAKHDANPDPAKNGALTAFFPSSLSDNNYLTDISFTPKQISPSGVVTSDDYLRARNLAGYLTRIATAGNWLSYDKLQDLYNLFTGNGNLIAGSSANVKALVNKLYQQVNGLTIPDGNTDAQTAKTKILEKILDGVTYEGSGNDLVITSLDGTSTTREGYPGNIGLPDGAAAMRWVATKPTDATDDGYPKFVPQVKVPAGNTMPLSDHDRFAYPPELYYYIDSPIKTSESSKESAYQSAKWVDKEGDDGVLNKYEHDDAVVASTTRSVAVKNPLDYAVGCLVTRIQAVSDNLEDNSQAAKDEEGASSTIVVAPVSVSDGKFPLTGIQIDGQYKQTYEFLPIADTNTKATEYIVYDNDITGVYLTSTQSGPAYTLAYQSRDGKPVDIVLEFLNNSGKLFYGYQNGIVYPGTKFYLIGQIWPPNPEASTENIDCRVFTKDHISSVQLTIQSLQNAYNVIPDLKTAQYAIKVDNVAVTQWSDGGSQNHELYNW